MPNAGYQYLGSPSPSGDVLNYITSPAGQLKMSAEVAGLLGAGSVGPLAALEYGLTGAGISGVANPIVTYALSGGKATPQQEAHQSQENTTPLLLPKNN